MSSATKSKWQIFHLVHHHPRGKVAHKLGQGGKQGLIRTHCGLSAPLGMTCKNRTHKNLPLCKRCSQLEVNRMQTWIVAVMTAKRQEAPSV